MDVAQLIGIDAFRKIDGHWSCAQAAAKTEVETGICLIFFTGSRGNQAYIELVDEVRRSMVNMPPLLVVQAADPKFRPLLMQMSLSETNLPQLFIVDITGVITPSNFYNGHRSHDALLSHLIQLQDAAVQLYTNNMMSTTSILMPPTTQPIVERARSSAI